MGKDRFVIKPQVKGEGFKPILVDVATHDLLTQMKEMTGVSITRLLKQVLSLPLKEWNLKSNSVQAL